MAEPLSPERLDEITEQAAQVVEVFGDDWYLVYDPDADEVSARTDEGAPPFEGAYTPVFETSQWPEGSPRSPLAEFLASSIVVVPELLGEVERLRAELNDLRGQNAMTESSFDAYAEQAGHDLAELRKENERLRAVRNAALARLGRAEQVMQLAVDQVEHFEAVHYLKRFLDERPGSGGGS